MKRKYRLVCIIYMMGLLLFPIYGQNNQTQGEDAGTAKAGFVTDIKPIKIELADEPAVMLGGFKITLGEAIKRAIESNYDILSGAYDVAMSDSAYESFKAKYPLIVGADTGGGYSKYPEGLQFFNGTEKKSYDATVSVAKVFSTGTTVAGGITHKYEERKNPPKDPSISDPLIASIMNAFADKLGPSAYYSPTFFLSLKQEFLKNVFGFNDMKREKILNNISRMQRDAILEALSYVVVSVIANYWDVVNSSATVTNLELQVVETRKVRNIIARNREVGLSDVSQFHFYNAQLAGAEASLASAKQRYRAALRNFLTTINMNEDSVVGGTAYFSNRLSQINVDDALKAAYLKRADYRNAELTLENAKLEEKIYSNEALPSLTAEFKSAFISQQEKAGDAYKDVASAKYPVLEGRVALSYPIDDSQQKINERNSHFKRKQAQIMFDKSRRVVKDSIYNAVDGVNTMYILYQKAKEAREQSEIAYNSMLGDLRKGRITSAQVKQSLDGLIQGRQAELNSLVYYNLSLLQFIVAKNELFEKYNINVNQYIPKK